jgi:hypothetical protein
MNQKRVGALNYLEITEETRKSSGLSTTVENNSTFSSTLHQSFV